MEGLDRLKQEVLEMNNFAISNIFNNIKDKPELQEKFNNKEKTIKEMYEYLYKKAKALQQNNVAMVSDSIVYLWSTNYFKYSNEELGIKKEEKPSNPVNVMKKKEVKEEKEENPQISLF